MKKQLTGAALIVMVCMTGASAMMFGTDITLYDREVGSVAGWYNRGSGPGEDEEVEIGMETGQEWDMEAFRLDGPALTVVGGINFDDSRTVGSDAEAGDVFIDVNGDVVFGPPADDSGYRNSSRENVFGYDYVIDLDFASDSYSVYALDASDNLLTVRYGMNEESNPWQYDSGGELLAGYVGVPLVTSGLLPTVDGLVGDRHYAFTVNLDFLEPGTEFTSHFTMRCGNDNLMGRARLGGSATPRIAPDAGHTVALLGLGMVATGLLRRLRRP